MDTDQIRRVLYAAARLRMPRREPDATLGLNIEQVEDYLIATAIHRAELEEARLYAKDALDLLADQWDEVEGWEIHLEQGKRATVAAVDRAKGLTAPELREGMREARRLIDRLTDQIKRLELDDKAASRRYTMMTGG